MLRFIIPRMTLSFWAAPHHSMDVLLLWADVSAERASLKLTVHAGVLAADEPAEKPLPVTGYPADVPAPEPHDVPTPEPRDVPPPTPRDVPSPGNRTDRPPHGAKQRPLP